MSNESFVHDTVARDARMKWWREARFGMFIHFNMFSRWMDEDYKHLCEHPDDYSREDYDRLRVSKLTPDKDAVRSWVGAAKAAGMKYVVLTTKHNGGFCLWNSKVTDFNSVRLGPRRDIVAEYVRACRDNGLRVGFYYALNDRQCPHREAATRDEAGRQAVIAYTRGLLRELMTGYGEVSILWYDEPWPLGYGGEWDSAEMNRIVRELQPGILINDRSLTAQDFTCPEGRITAPAFPDQNWEACMTFNGTWAWHPKDPAEYHTPRSVLDMLWQVTSGGGNLLLNVGPNPHNGQISDLETERLLTVGKWLERNGQAVYGPNDRPEGLGETKQDFGGKWTKHGNDAYLWLFDWPGKTELVIENVRAKLERVSLLPETPLEFQHADGRVTIRGLPKECPDDLCGVAVLKLRFASYPR